eukprot:s1137_g14.t1
MSNEVPTWFEADDKRGELAVCSSNLNFLSGEASRLGLCPVAPRASDWRSPTHFPRDETREGRQIDMLWQRRCNLSPVVIDGNRRHIIGSDHGAVIGEVTVTAKSTNKWGNDSRPRWVVGSLPRDPIVEADDVAALARACTRPLPSQAYRDSDEIKDAVAAARISNGKVEWKRVHKLRHQARHEWEAKRLSLILNGDWHQYREEQKTRLTDWDDLLQLQIDSIPDNGDFVPFTILEMRTELQCMKMSSAVGPDGISVHLLRCIAEDELLGEELLQLINHIVHSLELPVNWRKSFLALLAKKDFPESPKDLRPICVSSAFHKLVSRMVCARTMPLLRTGSPISGCGKGRQAADVIGMISRARDVVHEWKVPLLLCKLDISGAFDRVDRQRICEFLVGRLREREVPSELKYLQAQLRTYPLVGDAPGGQTIELFPNIGIKQGAPESAEIFGMIMDCLLCELVFHEGWKRLGVAVPGLNVPLVFYQDDIFILESDLGRLCKKINILERHLGRAGLCLATDKTRIVASQAYRGPRKVKVGENFFYVSPPHDSVKVLGLSFSLQESTSQQARELLTRAREAAAKHRELLRGRASWGRKFTMIKMLVESQFKWTAGALHWSAEDLRQANLLQMHILRDSFQLRRRPAESWVAWNTRTMRDCRAWVAAHGHQRWSTCILTLQHTLHGHWARRREEFSYKGRLTVEPCLPMKALIWRSTGWWRLQQQLSRHTGVRHEGRFYPSNVERQLCEVHGVRWFDCAKDRQNWSNERHAYLQRWDIRWTQGRQLALQSNQPALHY